MLNKTIISIIITLLSFASFAQQIPIGSCGIVNIYDAAGNRTKRTYFCNNGSNPYPQRIATQTTATVADKVDPAEFQEVDALYPNPTTGRFSVSFSKALDKATIHIVDESGKLISTIRARGYKIDIDLSAKPAGIYYVRIEDDGKTITKKVVKQ